MRNSQSSDDRLHQHHSTLAVDAARIESLQPASKGQARAARTLIGDCPKGIAGCDTA